MADRRVRVILEAQVSAFRTGMDQAAQATERASAAAEKSASGFNNASAAAEDAAAGMNATVSAASDTAADLEGAAAAADGAASGLESAGAAGESAGAGMEHAGAAGESAASGLDAAGAASESAGAGMDASGAAAERASSRYSESSAALSRLTGGMSGISAEAQNAAGAIHTASAAADGLSAGFSASSASLSRMTAGLSGVSAENQRAAAGFNTLSAAGQQVVASMTAVSAAAQQAAGAASSADASVSASSAALQRMAADGQAAGAGLSQAAAGMDTVSGAASSAAAGMDTAGAAGSSAAAGMENAGAAGQSAAAGLESAGAAGSSATAGLQGVSAAGEAAAGGLQSAAGASQAIAGGFNTLSASGQSVVGAMQSVSAASTGVTGQMSSLNRSILDTAGNAQEGFRTLGGGIAAAGGAVLAMVGYVGSLGIQDDTLQQVAGRAMETLTGSASAAADQMDRLHSFADTSPFARDVWIEAQQQLMAFGLEAEQVVPTLEGVQDAVAAIGGSNADIMQMVDILGTIQGQGRMTGVELRRMGQMGIDAADIMAQSMGTTGDAIRERITAGSMDAQTAINALADGMSTRFAGAAEGLRDTMEGSLDRIRARLRDLGSIIMTPLVNPNGGGFLVEAINQAADFGTRLLELPDPLLQVGGLLAGLAGTVGLAGGGFIALLPTLQKTWQSFTKGLGILSDFSSKSIEAAGGFRTLAAGAGAAAAAFALIAAADYVWSEVLPQPATLDEVARGLRDISTAGENTTGITNFSDAFDKLDTAGSKVQNAVPGWANTLMAGIAGNPAYLASAKANENLAETFGNVDTAVTDMVASGNVSQAGAAMQEIAEDFAAGGKSAEEFQAAFPGLVGALQDLAQEAGYSIDATDAMAIAQNQAALEALSAGESWQVVKELIAQGADAVYDAAQGMSSAESSTISYREALREAGEAASEAASAMKDLVSDLDAVAGRTRDSDEAIDSWIESLHEVNAVTEAGEQQLDRWSEAGRENRDNLRGMASEAREAAAGVADLGGSHAEVEEILLKSAASIQQAGEAAGLTQGEIDALKESYLGIPPEVDTDIWARDEATDIIDGVSDATEGVPDSKEINLRAFDDDVRSTIEAIESQDVETLVQILGNAERAEAAISAFEAGDYRAIAELVAEANEANRVVHDLTTGEYEVHIDINGDDGRAQETLSALMNGNYETIADILGDDSQALQVISAFQAGDWSTVAEIIGDDQAARGTIENFLSQHWQAEIDVTGNDGPARGVMNSFLGTPWNTMADIFGDASDAIGKASGFVNTDWNTTADFRANDGAARGTANAFITHPWQTTSDFHANDGSARNTANAFTGFPWQTTADVHGDDSSARGTMNGFIGFPWATDVTANAQTGIAEGALNNTARSRDSTVNAVANTAAAEAALNTVARVRSAAINVTRTVKSIFTGGNAEGGRVDAGLMSFSNGGRLPSTGLGTDEILGVNRAGNPTAWVDDREWVINRASSDKYDGLLRAINTDSPSIRHLAGLAEGGRPGMRAAERAPQMVSARQSSPTINVPQAPPVDTEAIGREVREAIRGLQLSVRIGQRQFAGAVVDAQQFTRQMGGR